MRVLFCADAPWGQSGYAVQAQSFLPRLAALPEVGGRANVAHFATFGLQGSAVEMGGFRIYPHGGGEHGDDLIGRHAAGWKADLVITLIDAWTQHDTAAKVYPARWVSWMPVDSDPVPQMTLDALKGATPLVYSRWGVEQLAKAGVPARYAPLGIEPGVFRRELDANRRAALRRRLVGNGCEHLTVMVAANIGGERKAFSQQLRGWATFAEDKPGARLYVHADPLPHYGGCDLRELVVALGIAGRVTFADSYQYFLGYPATAVAAMYQCADVYLGASMAEGFGLPIVEAQACGIPVVVTDFSSMPELVRWGWAVPPKDRYWAAGYAAWWAWPDSDGIAAALQALYEDGPYDALAQDASERMHAEYGWDVIVRDYWQPWLREWC